ncbi:hypothetical protein Tco_0103174 [Tanacetum coccineum]
MWCGGDKSSGPDDFNSKFIKKFWDVLKIGFDACGKWYCDRMEISRGCNASFVTIIPKIVDPIGLGDFKRISLIGCYYKIIEKILAERVKKVIGRLVGGFRIGNNSVVVSHLQYSDDIIFFDEWSKENAMSLMCILKCFEEVSALRVNYIKSKLYGVVVNDREIGDMAR